MSYTSRNPQFASVVVDDIASAAPTNPIAGKHKLVDRDGKIYLRNSAGAERTLDSQTNYIVYDKSATGWVASAAGSGGTALTVATVATAGELPRNSTSKTGIKIVAPSGDTTNAYVYYDFTLDSVDLNGKVVGVKWDQKPGAAAFIATDLVVDIVAQSDRTTTLVTPFTTALPVAEGTFQTYFLSPATAAVALRVKSVANAVTDAAVVISDIVVGPNVQVQGSAIGAWEAFKTLPTVAGFGDSPTVTAKKRIVGDALDIIISVDCGSY